MKYSIFEGNIERLEKKLKRVENKCKKYGAGFKYEIVGEEFKEVEYQGEKTTARFVIVDVEGFAKINDWQFVATIDHHEKRNVIRNIMDIDIPERYWTCDCYCEHCKRIRRRNDTFLVHNTVTGEFKQVGRSCLRDFTGGYDAELAASYIALYDSLIETEEVNEDSSFFGGTFTHYHELDTVLKMSKAIISKLGFVSSTGEGQSSKSVLFDLDYLINHGPNKTTRYLYDTGVVEAYESFDDDAYITALKEYYLNSEDTSSYMQNMKTIMSSNYCKYRDWGYIISSVFSYDRALEKDRQKKDAQEKQKRESDLSQYQGTVGQKIEVSIKEAKCICSSEDGFGGYSYLYKFIDNDGNCYMWSTGKNLETEKIIGLKGTVKDHKEYRGLKQTWVTRCKVTLGDVKEETHEAPGEDPMKAVDKMFKEMDSAKA